MQSRKKFSVTDTTSSRDASASKKIYAFELPRSSGPCVSLSCFVARLLLSLIYALSSVNFPGLKLRLCIKIDKFEVWASLRLKDASFKKSQRLTCKTRSSVKYDFLSFDEDDNVNCLC